ncbi:MAG: lamin tail domain-containing protein [Proteobacteria bacterium]|nr:lamin tail domain-containing protein [Pseudomonadota bacterium]
MTRYLLPILVLLGACTNESSLDRLPRAPEITIVTPVEGDLFRRGDGMIELHGTADDNIDPPEDLTVVWTVDTETTLDGAANADGDIFDELDPEDLELGFHDLTLQVTDRDDATAIATVRFEVQGPLGSPEVTITAPESGDSFGSDESVTFTGEATDATTAAADLTFAWDSSLVGPLDGAVSADGQSILVTDELGIGFHVVTLRVTDEDGEVGVDQVTITVSDPDVIASPGDLVFSELMINPQVVDDDVGEWVELYNTASYPIDIGGYTFHDDDVDHQVLPGPMLVQGNGYIVLCADMNTAVNGGVPCDARFERLAGDGGLALANNPDEVVLSAPDGTEIDWVHYNDSWFENGIAIGVDPDFLTGGDNDDASHWCLQTTVVSTGGEPGTPGLPNDGC